MGTSLGARIRDARSSRKLTQAALAIRADVNLRSLCRYEKDHVVPDATTIQKLCEALDVSADLLLGTAHPPIVAPAASEGE